MACWNRTLLRRPLNVQSPEMLDQFAVGDLLAVVEPLLDCSDGKTVVAACSDLKAGHVERPILRAKHRW